MCSMFSYFNEIWSLLGIISFDTSIVQERDKRMKQDKLSSVDRLNIHFISQMDF